jgi:hypothetical protein
MTTKEKPMADYLAQTRSNYFRVKNAEKFKAFCQRYNLEVITNEKPKKGCKYGFMVDGPIPTGRCNAKGDWIETDFLQELSAHLMPKEVAVVVEIGSEKMRYLNGYACAVNSKGKRIQVALTDIYKWAKETFGIEPTMAEY